MIPGIIFDLDGTLLNTLDDIADSFNYALQLHGLPQHPTQKYKEFIGSGAKVLAQRAVGGDDDALIETVLHDYRKYYALHSADKTAPYSGIPQMLSELSKKYKLAVLSNKPHEDTLPLVRRYFPDIPFCGIFGQRENVPRKPDPTAALQIAAQIGAAAYCGDSENDVRTAQNAKMPAIAVLWGFRDKQYLQGADFYCKTPADVIAAMEELNRA